MFGRLADLANLGNILKQMGEVKARMEAVRESLGAVRVRGEAGAGLVYVEMTGKLEVVGVHIEPELLNIEHKETLQTLLSAAFNDALSRAQDLAKEKMAEAVGDLKIPGITE